jgi:hypothetical protein
MNNAWLDILFLIIAAAVGYAVGLLDKRVTASRRQKKEEQSDVLLAQKTAEELEKSQVEIGRLKNELAERDQSIAGLQSALQKAAAAPPPSNDQTVLRALVTPTGTWSLEIDGKPVPLETLTAEQRQRLVAIIVQIRPWIDGKKIAPPSAPVPAPHPASAPPPAPVSVVPPSSSAYPVATDTSLPPMPPSINPLRGLRSMLANEVKVPESLSTISIIGMIDAILQQKLQNSPLADKKIKMEEGPRGEVLVHVGAQRYSGLDTVPDAAIRALIQEAIDEFNRSK